MPRQTSVQQARDAAMAAFLRVFVARYHRAVKAPGRSISRHHRCR